jgi:hypothetical protein
MSIQTFSCPNAPQSPNTPHCPAPTQPASDCNAGSGNGSSGGGSASDGAPPLVSVDVGGDTNGGGDGGSLLTAQVAGGDILDVNVGTSDDYSGVDIKVAVLADSGLLGDGSSGDYGSDGLLSVSVDGDVLDGIGSLIGDLGSIDLPDIGNVLDHATC